MAATVTVLWTIRATTHLRALYEYIASDNPPAAVTTLDRVFTAVERLSKHPDLGRRGRVVGTRELVIPGTPYLVAYRHQKSQLQVLAVLLGSRRWPDSF